MMAAKTSERLLSGLSEFVALRMGLSFPKERWADLERGLRRACSEFGFDNVESCGRWLMGSRITKAQVEILASHLTVGETYFFRDGNTFEALEGKILPELIQTRRSAGRYLRIWSAGCATGEEPYSLSILLRRLIPDVGEWKITILGTDINPSFLRRASRGEYGRWSFRGVPSFVQERYFRRAGPGRFEILPDIRKSVAFFYHNLVEDPCPSLLNNTNAMDLILCRNVLMYFSREGRGKVLRKLSSSLVEGGWLIVSPAEMPSVGPSPLLPVQFHGAMLYRKDSERTLAGGGTLQPTISESYGEFVARPVYDAPPRPAHGTDGTPAKRQKEQEAEAAVSSPADPFAEALASYERGRYADAEAKIRSLLNVRNDNGPALALLSRVYANRGRLTEARECCEKAVSADKLNPAYHYLLATILQEIGLPAESEACLKRTLYLDQDFVLAHFALGNLSLRQGKKGESRRHFRNALSVLRRSRPDEIVPESEGITVGRMREIIDTTVHEGASA
ncbi:MAG: tetratricopeptide repeat protein [Nitrospirae bacterium]|nr:tetratricopeptide repeat protein [Nitrospirota bacterium]